MRYLLTFTVLTLPLVAFSQSDAMEKVKAHLNKKQYNKAEHLITEYLSETDLDETINKSALWYYKGKLKSQMYFEKANSIKEDEAAYQQRSYTLLEGIAAFENACKMDDRQYRDMSFRQLGGLHHFLKGIGLNYLQNDNMERAYLNLRWARNCDRFAQKYLQENTYYQMDTLLIYLTIYTGELTGRTYESKSLYEELHLCGVDEPTMYIHNFKMLYGLEKMNEAEAILNKGLSTFPQSSELIFHMLHWYNTNDRYLQVIQLVDQKLNLLSNHIGKLHFIKGIAWNRLHDDAMLKGQTEVEEYFINSEACYKTALSFAPASFDYAYNLSALYYNKALLLSEEHKDSTVVQEKEYARMIQCAEKTLETAMIIKSDDTKVIGALEDIYRRTNQTEKLLKLQNSKG